MFDRLPKRPPASDIDDGFPFASLAAEIALPSDVDGDDLPITAVMNALSGREVDARNRRDEVELSIRTHWATLCRLVAEYEALSEETGLAPSSNVTLLSSRPAKPRGLVPPTRRARQVA
jgi:hypothetical protein